MRKNRNSGSRPNGAAATAGMPTWARASGTAAAIPPVGPPPPLPSSGGPPEAGDEETGPEEDGQFIDAQGVGGHAQGGDGDQRPRLQGVPPEPPQRLHDHGDDHRLDAVEQPGGLGPVAEPHVGPGEGQDDQRRRGDEAGPGDQQPRPAGTVPADVDGHLGRVGAGDQVGRPEQVEELGLREPAPAADDLMLHQGDVRRRAAEGGRPQAEEQPGQLAQRRRPCGGRRGCLRVVAGLFPVHGYRRPPAPRTVTIALTAGRPAE